MAGWIYFMADRPHGAIYIGVTSELIQRVTQHRSGVGSGFTQRYGLRRLVYVERHPTIVLAIQREKTLKHWRRAWKIRLIHRDNPGWDDLYGTLML
jgi:putative endonuclease